MVLTVSLPKSDNVNSILLGSTYEMILYTQFDAAQANHFLFPTVPGFYDFKMEVRDATDFIETSYFKLGVKPKPVISGYTFNSLNNYVGKESIFRVRYTTPIALVVGDFIELSFETFNELVNKFDPKLGFSDY